MTRETKDRRCFWSDKHHHVLLWAAYKTLKSCKCKYPSRGESEFSVEELVSIGWMTCLRRVRSNDMKKTLTNLLATLRCYIARQRKRNSKYEQLDSQVEDEITTLRREGSVIDSQINLIGLILSENQCSVCGKVKRDKDFYRKKDGRKAYTLCKMCLLQKKKEERRKKKEERRKKNN